MSFCSVSHGRRFCFVLSALFLHFFLISGLAGGEAAKAIDRLLHTLRIDAGSGRGQIGATRAHRLSGSVTLQGFTGELAVSGRQ